MLKVALNTKNQSINQSTKCNTSMDGDFDLWYTNVSIGHNFYNSHASLLLSKSRGKVYVKI